MNLAGAVVRRLLASDEIKNWNEALVLRMVADQLDEAQASMADAVKDALQHPDPVTRNRDVAIFLRGEPVDVTDREFALLKRVVDRAADPTAFSDTDPKARIRGTELADLATVLGSLVTEHAPD